jgi:hypothetical protein
MLTSVVLKSEAKEDQYSSSSVVSQTNLSISSAGAWQKVRMEVFNVRVAEPDDDLIPLMVDHATAVGFSSYDVTKFRAVVDSFILNNGSLSKVCLVLVGSDNIPCGYIFAMISDGFLTNDLMANELGFYCARPGHGGKLIDAYEVWAKVYGATKVTLSSHGTDRLDNYYARKGYSPKEKTFVKDLD